MGAATSTATSTTITMTASPSMEYVTRFVRRQEHRQPSLRRTCGSLRHSLVTDRIPSQVFHQEEAVLTAAAPALANQHLVLAPLLSSPPSLPSQRFPPVGHLQGHLQGHLLLHQ